MDNKPYEWQKETEQKARRNKREMTHTPFKSWRRYCIMGRAMDIVHKKNRDSEDDEQSKAPRIIMAYFDMSKDDVEATTNPMRGTLWQQGNKG